MNRLGPKLYLHSWIMMGIARSSTIPYGQVVCIEGLGIPYVLESSLAAHISPKHTQ